VREITDALGGRWDVAVGRESWGTQVLLFASRDRPETRSVVLATETPMAAERELDALTDEELRARLAEARVVG
jgi:hypothetical protein